MKHVITVDRIALYRLLTAICKGKANIIEMMDLRCVEIDNPVNVLVEEMNAHIESIKNYKGIPHIVKKAPND